MNEDNDRPNLSIGEQFQASKSVITKRWAKPNRLLSVFLSAALMFAGVVTHPQFVEAAARDDNQTTTQQQRTRPPRGLKAISRAPAEPWQFVFPQNGNTSEATGRAQIQAPVGQIPHEVYLYWPTAGAASYNMYRGLVSGGPYTKINTSPITTTYYTDQTVSASTTYYYAVKSVNSQGQEGQNYSPQVTAAVPTSNPATTAVTVLSGGTIQVQALDDLGNIQSTNDYTLPSGYTVKSSQANSWDGSSFLFSTNSSGAVNIMSFDSNANLTVNQNFTAIPNWSPLVYRQQSDGTSWMAWNWTGGGANTGMVALWHWTTTNPSVINTPTNPPVTFNTYCANSSCYWSAGTSGTTHYNSGTWVLNDLAIDPADSVNPGRLLFSLPGSTQNNTSTIFAVWDMPESLPTNISTLFIPTDPTGSFLGVTAGGATKNLAANPANGTLQMLVTKADGTAVVYNMTASGSALNFPGLSVYHRSYGPSGDAGAQFTGFNVIDLNYIATTTPPTPVLRWVDPSPSFLIEAHWFFDPSFDQPTLTAPTNGGSWYLLYNESGTPVSKNLLPTNDGPGEMDVRQVLAKSFSFLAKELGLKATPSIAGRERHNPPSLATGNMPQPTPEELGDVRPYDPTNRERLPKFTIR